MADTDYATRTGSLFIRNFDQGVIETLGGYLARTTNPVLLRAVRGHNSYFIDVTAADPMTVPVFFNNPEPIRKNKIYPSFLVTRMEPIPAMQRWMSVGQKEYRVPSVSGVPEVIGGVSGWSMYEEKVQDMPFDLTYTIGVHARYEHEAVPMLKKVLSIYKPYCKIDLLDSLGARRSYSAFVESVTDIGEIIDAADRMKGFNVDLRVEGELSLSDPQVSATVREIISRENRKT